LAALADVLHEGVVIRDLRVLEGVLELLFEVFNLDHLLLVLLLQLLGLLVKFLGHLCLFDLIALLLLLELSCLVNDLGEEQGDEY